MKIKLSKSQWEQMGKQAGWSKEAALSGLEGVSTDYSDPDLQRPNVPKMMKNLISFATDAQRIVVTLNPDQKPSDDVLTDLYMRLKNAATMVERIRTTKV